ncbi:hypothetical protein [Paragemmobacter ruber]|uniref:Uncharacterized protein n=1 Tax=Paragemmobacter ruber TaxID=1985673 RepID=A0ABW9Y6C7_9RHOB|nr:hypothetical protein [Rhodobacter ruber]NBE07646.1 hypothetical protein [Rhodobacter ruber]
MIQHTDDMPDFLRRLAQRTIEDGLMNLTEAERIDVATELYRLADAITVEPVTQGDIEARRQAIRRVDWLIRWLDRAAQKPPMSMG